jgi:hypothetical protein
MKRPSRVLAAAIGLALFAAACGDDSETEAESETTTTVGDTATTTGDGASGAVDLSADCPNPLVIQKDWLAEIEHAPVYQLIGPDGEMSENVYEGPLGDTGIDLKIIDGGPGVGEGQTIVSTLYTGNLKTNEDVDLAFVSTDDAAIFSEQFPTTAVMAPLRISPQILFWDPETYPEGFSTVDDLIAFAETGNKIYVTSIKESYGRWLVEQGVPEDAFLEGYAGDAENFVTNGGKWINQGYASNEVWDFENGRGWEAPVDYVLVNDLGYEFYPGALAVATERLEELTPCLEKFVPLLQQATVDYVADPGPINQMLADYNEAGYGAAYWKTPIELNDAGFQVMMDEEIIANEGGTLGGFDLERVQATIDNVSPSFDDRSNPDVTPEDLVTNDFIDPSIALP